MIPFRPRLIEWLTVLSLEDDKQLDFLKKIGGTDDLYIPVNELSLEYYEIMLQLNRDDNQAGLPTEAIVSLKKLEQYLDGFRREISDDLWSYDALRTSSVWTQVRTQAKRCLELLEFREFR